MKLGTILSTTLVTVGALVMSPEAAADASSSSEDARLFRPVRVGACIGTSAECMAAGAKLEFAGQYVGASVELTLGAAVAVKAYPLPIYHSGRVSARPYLYAATGTFWGTNFVGGGVGADIHLLESKRLVLQPSLSFQQFCSGGNVEDLSSDGSCPKAAGGSMSLMAAF